MKFLITTMGQIIDAILFISQIITTFMKCVLYFINMIIRMWLFLGRDTTDREGYPITKILPLKLDIEMQTLITQTLTAMRGDEK